MSSMLGDQADGLRRLFQNREPQVVAFTSGRDDGGRTALLAQTARVLALTGQGVVAIDENSGPESLLAAYGLVVKHDLLELAQGKRGLSEVACPVLPSLTVVSAAKLANQTAAQAASLSNTAQRRLAQALDQMRSQASFVLVDCANQRAGHLSWLAASARHMAVVVAARGIAITQAYALIKQMAKSHGRDRFQIVVTQAKSNDDGRAIFENMRKVARQHLSVRLDSLGVMTLGSNSHLADALVQSLPPTLAKAAGMPAWPGDSALPDCLEPLDSMV